MCKSFSIFLEMPFLFKLVAWRLNFHEFKIFEASIKLCISRDKNLIQD